MTPFERAYAILSDYQEHRMRARLRNIERVVDKLTAESQECVPPVDDLNPQWGVRLTDKDYDDHNRTQWFRSEELAQTFIDGIELVNDSALSVELVHPKEAAE